MSKPTTGSLAITAWRNDDYFEYPLRVVGLDLSALVLKMEIRASGDTPGPALVRLDGVAQDQYVAQGLRVAGVSVVDGVEVSDLRIRMDRGSLQELDYQGELGSPAVFEYALLIGGLTRLIGPFILPAHAFGSNAAPAARPASYAISQPAGAPNGGATLTISQDGGATVLMDGADLVSASIIRAEDAAEQTAADRDTVEGIASTSYQAVPTYAAREAIPLAKRQNGMRVQVMEGTPRVFEWRTDLYMPGAWVGQYTPAEIKNLGIDFTGQLASNQVAGLTDAQDAIDSIAAIDIAGFRATALSGDANPKVELAWEVKGTPTAQTISWGSSTIAIAAAARSFTPKDWAAVKPIFIVGNSLSTDTDVTTRWSQLLAADRKQPSYNVARYTSDWSQVYRSGAAPLYLTIAGGALPAGGTAAAVTLINGSAPTASPSANPASFLNTGDGGLTTGVSMAGTIVAGTTARHVTVSIPNAASTAYSIVQDAGATALPLTGPVLFIPDIAKQIETSDLILWTGNNYYYSGVGNAYGDYTNPQMWVDMARIVAAAAGNRVLILPILPAADEPADGTPNPNVPGEKYHLQSARAAANARTEALFPTAIARDAQGRTLLKRLQDSGNGSANDNADVAAGVVPRSLRSDALHLNAAGDAVVFAFVKEALARQALPSPVTQGTVFTLTAIGANPRTGTEVRDTAYAVVRGGELAALLDPLRASVDGVQSQSEYRPTLAQAVADLGVGTFFVSRDGDGVSAYPGVKRHYQRVANAPSWADRGPFVDADDVGLGAYPADPSVLPLSADQAAAIAVEATARNQQVSDLGAYTAHALDLKANAADVPVAIQAATDALRGGVAAPYDTLAKVAATIRSDVFVVQGAKANIDAYPLIAAAVAAAKAAGGGTILLPHIGGGGYRISQTIVADFDDCTILLDDDVTLTKTTARDFVGPNAAAASGVNGVSMCAFLFEGALTGANPRRYIKRPQLIGLRKVKIDGNGRNCADFGTYELGKVGNHGAVAFGGTIDGRCENVYAYGGLTGCVIGAYSPGFATIDVDVSHSVYDNGIYGFGNAEHIRAFSDSDPSSWGNHRHIRPRAWSCANHGIGTYGSVGMYVENPKIWSCGNNTGTAVSGPAGGLGVEYGNDNPTRDLRFLAVNVEITGSYGFGFRTNAKGTRVLGGFVRGTKIPTAYSTNAQYDVWGNGIFIQGAATADVQIDSSDNERAGAHLIGTASGSPELRYRGRMEGNAERAIRGVGVATLDISPDSQFVGNGSDGASGASPRYVVDINNGPSNTDAGSVSIAGLFDDNRIAVAAVDRVAICDLTKGIRGHNNLAGYTDSGVAIRIPGVVGRVRAANVCLTNTNAKTSRLVAVQNASFVEADIDSVNGQQLSNVASVDLSTINSNGLYADRYLALGGVAPTFRPVRLGQKLIDTSGAKAYIAKGTIAAADWLALV